MLEFIEEYLIPLLLLEAVFQTECVPLPGDPLHVSTDLERSGRRHLWHGVFVLRFSTSIDANLGLVSIELCAC